MPPRLGGAWGTRRERIGQAAKDSAPTPTPWRSTRLAALGASVAIWERNEQTWATAADTISALGAITNVRESAQVDAALARTLAELGPVSILVNNAGGVFTFATYCCARNAWRG